MTEEQLDAICNEIGGAMIKLYASCCERVPKGIVMTALTGGLAACATEAGFDRDNVVAALNAAFDDIVE